MFTARAFAHASSLVLALPLVAVVATSAGCSHNANARANSASAANPVSTTTLTGGEMPTQATEELPPMAQVNDRRAAQHDQQARLVVSQDIVRLCPNVQMMGNQDFHGPAEEAWVAVLGSVASCLNHGDLGAENLQVTGPNEGSTAVGYVLAKLGVDLSRLQAVDDFGEDLCIHDHSCAVSTVRIELVAPKTDDGTHI
jgi:hypothetical protein